MTKILHQVLSSPGEIVSFSELNKRGVFKKTIEQMNGKRLMEHVGDEMDKLQLGQVHRFTVAGNSCQVKSSPLFGGLFCSPLNGSLKNLIKLLIITLATRLYY